jgi:hypothetical protein
MRTTINELVDALDKWADQLFDVMDTQVGHMFGDEEWPTGSVTITVDVQLLDSVHYCMVKAGTALDKLVNDNQDLRNEVRTLLSVLQARGAFNSEQ